MGFRTSWHRGQLAVIGSTLDKTMMWPTQLMTEYLGKSQPNDLQSKPVDPRTLRPLGWRKITQTLLFFDGISIRLPIGYIAK